MLFFLVLIAIPPRAALIETPEASAALSERSALYWRQVHARSGKVIGVWHRDLRDATGSMRMPRQTHFASARSATCFSGGSPLTRSSTSRRRAARACSRSSRAGRRRI